MPDQPRLAFAPFPPQDKLFAQFLAACWGRVRERDDATPQALERELRTFHTRAVVYPRSELAGFGDEVWYVYRDGRPSGRAAGEWWSDPGTARVRFSADGRYISADDAACALVGLPPGGLTGKRLFDVVTAEAARAMEQVVWPVYDAVGELDSVFDCPLPDGSTRVIEYHSRRSSETGIGESAWREIALLPASSSV